LSLSAVPPQQLRELGDVGGDAARHVKRNDLRTIGA